MLAATRKRSDKLELFCQAYVGTLGNATQAYTMAGYAKNTAQVESCKALSLPMVRERIIKYAATPVFTLCVGFRLEPWPVVKYGF